MKSWRMLLHDMTMYAQELGYCDNRAFIEASWFMYLHVPYYVGRR